MSYGLPRGTQIYYGGAGFPEWVGKLGKVFNLKASTYPGHQEDDRVEVGYAPNPARLNRGIDWAGSVDDMEKFARYLLTVRSGLEQVIWENPRTGKRVGVAGGADVSSTGYFASDYSGHRDHVHTRQSKPIPIPAQQMAVDDNRPDFNEYAVWSPNGSSRNGVKPDLILLHTEESTRGTKDAADRLARWMQNPAVQVSYHYAISMDEQDRGVTVVDVRDTDLTSWSVLSANPRSINIVFAGSRAAWTREEWLRLADRAIDVAAYLAVQDCRKYGIPFTVIAPPYTAGRAGISDHRYVTRVLGDGTHTDVGDGFPWDTFAAAVLKYSGQSTAPKPPPPVVVPPVTPPVVTPPPMTDRQLLEAIWADLQFLKGA